MAFAVRACAWLGDRSRAAVLYEQLREYAPLNVVITLGLDYMGSVELYLGQLAATTERWDEAERHYEAARRAHEEMRSPPWCAHTDHLHARMLLERGRGEDRSRARELLDRAGRSARSLGMAPLARRVEELSLRPEPTVTK